MPPDAEVIDSTAEEMAEHDEQLEEERGPGQELELAPPGTGAIIRAERPGEIIAKATEIADALKDLVDRQGLAVNVGGKRKHVEVGGWQALGTMLGALGGQPLHAETVWTRRVLDDDGRLQRTRYTAEVTRYPKGKGQGKPVEVTTYEVDGFDWEACVEIRTPDGTVVGRAEAMVSRAESKWAKADDYACRSMAETRAESRAFRRAVGWIVNIAGYNPTPAEEMPGNGERANDEEPAQAPSALLVPAANGFKTGTIRALTYLLQDDEVAAKEVWEEIVTLAGGAGVPMVAASAWIATAKRLRARLEDAGATEERPPAGTVEDTPENRARWCSCKNPDAPKDEAGAFDDTCPITAHGIPF